MILLSVLTFATAVTMITLSVEELVHAKGKHELDLNMKVLNSKIKLQSVLCLVRRFAQYQYRDILIRFGMCGWLWCLRRVTHLSI